MAKGTQPKPKPAPGAEATASSAVAQGQSDTGTAQTSLAETEGTGSDAPPAGAPPAEAPKTKASDEGATKVVTVTTNAERGRWRIGRHFSREATVIPAADLTAAQLDALQGDPVLIVTIGVAATE